MPIAPLIDVRETEHEYLIEAQMPGVAPDRLDATTDGHTLVIRAPFGEQGEDSREGQLLIHERPSGTYARAIALPQDVDADTMTASFQDAVLTVKLPKAPEGPSHRLTIARPTLEASGANGHGVPVMAKRPKGGDQAGEATGSETRPDNDEAQTPAEPVASAFRRFGLGGDRRPASGRARS